jgi:hypothetical protein
MERAKMKCNACQCQMQRETVVQVSRVRGRIRSVTRPGWYCWTCRQSRAEACSYSSPPPAASSGQGASGFRAWTGASSWQAG